jgi:hypothetical protein
MEKPMYQLQLEVSGKWLDCGPPIDDMNVAIAKYREREDRKSGDAFRLLRIDVIRPLFDK